MACCEAQTSFDIPDISCVALRAGRLLKSVPHHVLCKGYLHLHTRCTCSQAWGRAFMGLSISHGGGNNMNAEPIPVPELILGAVCH